MSFLDYYEDAIETIAADSPAFEGGGSVAVCDPAPCDGVAVVDEALFVALVERHRPGLQAHCYRMLGSFEDAEDQVQETALRAWRKRDAFEGRSTMHAWLYKIATNACLDLLRRRAARVVPAEEQSPDGRHSSTDRPPDAKLEKLATGELDPELEAIDRETIELVFLVAIQRLRPDQRSVLIFRDVLGWSAKETATILSLKDTAVHSSLLRARATIREHLTPDRIEWGRLRRPGRDEREILERCLAAHEEGDAARLADLLQLPANLRVLPPHY
jgi:RNA polymerase sigma-70 factor (ECF subfamily)